MARRKRRKFTPEFKAEAVRLTRIGDRSIGQVALDLDLMETHLRDCGPRLRLDRRKAPKTGELVVRAEAMVA